MRIMHLDEQRGWRGGEQQASYLIRGCVRRGHEVYIAGRAGTPFVNRDHGAAMTGVLTCPFRGEIDVITARQLANAVHRYGIDILHAHTSHTHTIACLARMFAGGGKVVVSRRVDFPPSVGALSRLKYRLPDHYIAISNRIHSVLLDAGVPESRVSVVRSAVDPERLDAPTVSRAALGVPENAYVLGNVAALVDHKDQATLISAMRLVVESIPRAHLVIAGEGPLRLHLESLRDQQGLGERVHFLGYRNDIPGILRSLDAFVMSSKEEGLGTSVLDAMVCGAPVVATAGGGIPEMVCNEMTGLLTPVGDVKALAGAIVRLARTPELGARLANAAQTYVLEHFHVDAMVDGNLAVYDRVLAQSRDGEPSGRE